AGAEIDRGDLVRFSNFLTDHYAGRTVREIRDELLHTMAEERRHLDAWLRHAMAFAQQALADQAAPRDVLVEGASSLLGRPEFSDLERVRRMLDTFADKARLANVLSLCLEAGDGVRVYLGEDSEVTSELEFSVVAAPYGADGTALGSLGVIGPSRMEYPRVVPLVRYLGQTLTRALAREGVAQDGPRDGAGRAVDDSQQ
ncbi:MAG: HrcA family transcriptional regulator, partial [Acidobacteriota bacterium]